MTIRSELADLPWPDLVSAAREAIPVCSDAHWQVDLEAGTITHGDEPDARVDPIQVIGTFDASDGTWMWGWDHTSVLVEWGAAAARLKSYGERHHRDDLTTAVVTTDAAAAQDFGFAGALVWGAHELMAAPAGRITAYLAIGSGAPGEGEATALPDLVPVPGFERPRAAAPEGIPLTHPLLTAPPPPFTGQQAIAVVASYLRQMHPLYHLARGDDPSLEALEMRTAAQEALRAAFWRRDGEDAGASLGFDRKFDLAAMTRWDARPVGPRLWQVTYARRLDAAAMNEGYLVMLFDDAPQLVDKIVAD